MRTLGIIGLICGAAAAALCCTENGRSMLAQAKETMQDRMAEMRGGETGSEPRELVEGMLEQPHPDTMMAQAFEDAVTA
jgi:hypothetical protein